MVKNTSGGTGHKSQARKFASSTKSNVLRCPAEDGEYFAQVAKNFGGGICDVVLIINNTSQTMRCQIRGKFRSRNRKHNSVTVGSLLLVGLREWEAPNYKICDVLEVYEPEDMQLFTSMPQMMTLIQPLISSYQFSSVTKEKLNTTNEIDFTSDAANEQLKIDTTETFYENDVEINIDDI
jgi:hypothetical protein